MKEINKSFNSYFFLYKNNAYVIIKTIRGGLLMMVKAREKQKNIIKVNKKCIMGMVDICEKLGFVFVDDPNNKGNYIVSFPEGWSEEYNKRLEMYSFFDEEKRYRGSMVYFPHNGYAEISLTTYYDIQDVPVSKKCCEVYFGTYENKLYSAGVYKKEMYDKNRKLVENLYTKAIQWADVNYPDWQDPTAYWDKAKVNKK